MRIAVYGATGYTGALVADELKRCGVDFVLGARSKERLGRLAHERGLEVPLRAASIDDPASLRALLDDCDAVINCAGPFTLAGEPVVRAALDASVHYVDSTGEQAFIKLVFDRYGAEAKERGIALVPAAGFDYVPGDCIARLAAMGCEPLSDITVAYAVAGFGASRGTLLSVLEVMGAAQCRYADGNWRYARPVPERRSFDFGPPVGRQPVISFPAGEVVTVPRHTDTGRVETLLTARTFVPGAALAPAVGYLRPLFGLAGKRPVKTLLRAAIARGDGDGPDAARRQAAAFTVKARARGVDGSIGQGVVSGRDPYGLTAVSLVYAARRMAEPSFDNAGALAPAQAVDAQEFLEQLVEHGLTWQTDHTSELA